MPARHRLRRILVPLVAVFVVVAVAAGVLGVGLVRRSFPQTDGVVNVPGLTAPVTVLRDERGVAHIYADTAEDLFAGQGYVAAQDRFFQMDLRRHVTAGRLSELVGEGGLDTDKVIRTMGWRQVAEQELPMLSADARRYLQAYAAGVNAYLADNPAPSQVALEYAVLSQQVGDYRIEPWTEVDSLAWLKAMAWDLRGNYEDELARARLVGSLSLAQLASAYPSYPFELNEPILSAQEWSSTPVAPGGKGAGGRVPGPLPAAPDLVVPHAGLSPEDLAGAYDEALRTLAAVPPLLGHGEGLGSNSWVVSGAHTESGKPLLANDPHLGVTQPGVWLQAGLHCRTVSAQCPFDVTGFTFAGFPGVVIGHNTHIAWGFTNLNPDVTDFYLEEIREEDDTYRRADSWVPLELREEVIKVPGQDDVPLTVRSTRHGPVLSDVISPIAAAGKQAPINAVRTSSSFDVSMAWTGLEPARTAEAVFALNRATGWEDFRSAARLFAVPSQNLIYADTAGNIGYQAPGLIPVRQASTNGAPPGYWPALGSDPAYDWKGWVPFSQLPWAFNPEDGMIVTANQAVTDSRRPFLTSEWDSGYRAERILTLLREHLAEGKLTGQTMSDIQGDTYNSFADVLLPHLLDVRFVTDFSREPQQLLKDWDRTAPIDGDQSAAAMYYYAIWSHLLDLTFDDELPRDLYPDGNSRWMLAVSNLLEDPENEWWDDKRTVGVVESRDTIVKQAMIDARLDLTRRISKDPKGWAWGKLHQVPLRHEVFGGDDVPDLVRAIFNDGPHQVPGGSSLVNANNWDAASGGYRVTSAPSMRMVVDLADLDASTWVNQTGSSGHPFDPHYNDQTLAWLAGETYPWPSSEQAVRGASVHELTLKPAED